MIRATITIIFGLVVCFRLVQIVFNGRKRQTNKQNKNKSQGPVELNSKLEPKALNVSRRETTQASLQPSKCQRPSINSTLNKLNSKIILELLL